MTLQFGSIHNYHEDGVIAAVLAAAPAHPALAQNDDLLADVACVALNNLPARYIRHAIDLSFYLTEKERAKSEDAIAAAVASAIEFVLSRAARRARG